MLAYADTRPITYSAGQVNHFEYLQSPLVSSLGYDNRGPADTNTVVVRPSTDSFPHAIPHFMVNRCNLMCHVCVCVCVCVHVCVCTRVHVCVCARPRVCVRGTRVVPSSSGSESAFKAWRNIFYQGIS